ncbi:O-antigen ligase family protein [Helicobacter cinaedi]|uniref:O-antigen ligase family protein n=1 Tax=Helicobacter cinaedi TaxID=213 RepID=UPI000CF0FD69|nr:O-antigen ligase family protein [Helicobacter cinaedi]
MEFIKKYNQELTLGLFCVGIVLYGLGLSGFGKSFNTQTLFHIVAFLVLVFGYKKIHWRDILQIRSIALCLFIVLLCGLLTLFDTRMGLTFSQKLKTINTHTINTILFFFIAYFYALYAEIKYIRFLLCIFALMCAICVIASVCVWLGSGFETHNVPLYFDYLVMLNVWLLGAVAVCLVGLVYPKRAVRILSFVGLCLCVLAIISNGERSFLLALIGMCMAGLFVLRYQYKRYIVGSFLLAFVPLCYGVYLYTATLSDRYNFAHLADNIIAVWNTNPIEMGQYDVGCFGKYLVCSQESLERGKNDISIEHSSLARIAMYKSALHLIMQEPLKPRIIGSWNVGTYLYAYYAKDNPYRVYIDTFTHNGRDGVYGYSHIHSTPVSLGVEYGLLGLLAIAAFIGLIGIKGLRASKYSLLGSVVALFVVGMCIQTQFDVMYGINLRPLMLFFGLFMGYVVARKCGENPTNNQ